MSSSRGKKVHYERGTKGSEKHGRHHSRDSGVGSSSASDRASLGTSPLDESPFNDRQIRDQRHSLTALQEALDAAYEKIRQLQSDNAKMNTSLAESNKENRALKKERIELLNRVEDLEEDLEDERKANERFRRESSPRSGGTPPSRTERRTTPPKREHTEPRPRRREDERSQASYSEHRTTYMPVAPQAPPSQNPFTPLSPISTRAPSASYTPAAVTYAQTPVTYTTSPIYSSPPLSDTSTRYPPNDGGYHLYPVD
ncbi:hypothetical protein D0Z07_1884 [Hyphodiscus hymeniophilus]|uniref:Uncharacterized protein n=1 Tax=Hyphodiscus hymeniophilus TaxID=353542 RepID=A0A9P6VNF4_9HELO|nr:hypothetical protein D0Z07_1884 [Hyphodiscus hymeniophilus]